MFRITTSILLLLIVVCGQVLSGVSCCCLARSLAIGSYDKAEVADQAPAPRCPKCAVHSNSEQAGSASQHKVTCPNRPSRSGDVLSRSNTCSCVKTPLIASQSDEQLPLTARGCGWVVPAYISTFYSSLSLSSMDRFDLAARFGGGTWQSIACIWRN